MHSKCRNPEPSTIYYHSTIKYIDRVSTGRFLYHHRAIHEADYQMNESNISTASVQPGGASSRPIFVFDFGSCYFRYATSVDSEPHVVPHCAAYRKTLASSGDTGADIDVGSSLSPPPSTPTSSDRWSHVLSLYRTVLKEMRKIGNPSVQLRAPKWVSTPGASGINQLVSSEKVLFGERALSVPVEHASHWDVVFPIVRGRLVNVSVMSDIWIHFLKQQYPENAKNLSKASAFVAVPDSFSRSEIRDLVQMLFSYPFEFGDIYLHLQSACSVFGTGVGSGIIVNIGDCVTTLAAVVDGYVYPPSRMVLPYGGYDIAETLSYIFKNLGGFPYSQCNIEVRQVDRDIFYELVETYVHAAAGHEAFKSVTFSDPVSHKTHRADCGDVLLLPALGLIYPFIFDERGGVQMLSARPQDEIVSQDRENSFVEPYLPEDLCDEPFAYETAPPFRPRYFRTRESGLIEAIRDCTAKANDLFQTGKKTVTNDLSLLIIGGTSQIPGLIPLVSERSKLEAISLPEGVSPQIVSWKGAAYAAAQVDRDHRLWISKTDWETGGIRHLREKCPFSF